MSRPDDGRYRFRIGSAQVLAGLLAAVTLLHRTSAPPARGDHGVVPTLPIDIGAPFARWSKWGPVRYPDHTVGGDQLVGGD